MQRRNVTTYFMILLLGFLATCAQSFSPGLETAGAVNRKKWDVFVHGGKVVEPRFKESSRVAILHGKKVKSTGDPAPAEVAAPAPATDKTAATAPAPEEAATPAAGSEEAETAAPAPEEAAAPAPAPQEAAAPAPATDKTAATAPAPEKAATPAAGSEEAEPAAASVPAGDDPVAVPVATSAPAPAPADPANTDANMATLQSNPEALADAVNEINKDAEEEAANKAKAAEKAATQYNECISNCKSDKIEAEQGDGSCCGGVWYRYLCFCYAGTCCA